MCDRLCDRKFGEMVKVYPCFPKKELSSIRIGVTHNKVRRFIHPDIIISTKQWDAKKQRFKPFPRNPAHIAFNNKMDDLDRSVQNLILERRMSGVGISYIELKHFILDQLKGPEEKEELFTDFLQEWLTHRDQSKKFSLMTMKKDRSHVKFMTKILNETYGDCTWENVGSEMFEKIRTYLYERSYATNYTSAILTTLRKIVRFKEARNKLDNIDFLLDVSIKSAPSESIYHDEKELKRILDVDLINYPGLTTTRVQYLTACWSGVAYGDIDKIKDNIQFINGYEVIVFRRSKGTKEQAIPLHPVVKRFLNEYDGQLPKVKTNQKMNEQIKKICKLAGINEVIYKTKYSGPQRIVSRHEKWELATTHTGRRSFATNALLAGIPINVIMNITGHTKEDSFWKYIKMKGRESAIRVAQHPFFAAG